MLTIPRSRIIVLSALLLLIALVAFAAGPAPASMARAEELFEAKHYREAAEAYSRLVEEQAEGWHRAAERLIMCRLRLQLFDGALEAAEDYVRRTAGTRQEARAERLTAHLYMLLPHWGTRSGGEFYRDEHRQGVRLHTWQYDKRHAVAHMERARRLYAQYDSPGTAPQGGKEWHTERIECIFDLANLVSRFTIYDDEPSFWFRWWQERDEFLAETAGEEDFEEALPYWEMHRKRPIGLRVGPEGEPIFPTTPDGYSSDLPDDEKLLYLLAEVRELDRTPERRHTALSYYRQAMLARKRFGMDRLNSYAALYSPAGSRPLQQELEEFNPWELGDGEALVLAGGRIRRVALPRQWDVFSLLRTVSGDYRESGVAETALYATGVYYQSRQQYVRALGEYERLRELFPDSREAGNAATQIARIRAPQVRLSQTGVQLPGRPPELQVSYRNLDKLWFVARPIDVEALLADLHKALLQPPHDRSELEHLLSSWHNALVWHDTSRRDVHFVAPHVGPPVEQWAARVEDGDTHRYAQATIRAPFAKRGAYLVYAYMSPPPKAHAGRSGMAAIGLGASRAVLVLNDLALVGKPTTEGNLYYVADAVTGAPCRGAQIDVLERWSRYDRKTKKHLSHAASHALRTDRDGMALLQTPRGRSSRLHVVASAPRGRLAWSGMSYSHRYRPSRMRAGMFAYVITDRPVYRPEQTVHFKAWLRRTREGALENLPQQRVQVTVYDPRGEKVFQSTKRTDDFGGLEGEFRLDEEPPLGVYRIEVGRQYAGQGSFRVEEYRKPEFEVTVEPDTSHARLGQKVNAVIEARYYFGEPVADATVSYKVFREEYTHSYHFPGEWDWLYGAGYGLPSYHYEWFPWWGYSGRSPARELVQEGETAIGPEGTVEVEIDTAPALRSHPDRDHRYIVRAEVRDPSRRVITGEGSVKVTRQAFYAVIRSDRGYYRPGEEMEVTVHCMTPDGEPVQTEGVLTVSRVVFGGPDNARIAEEELERWTASTDGRGELKFRLRHERSDQLKIRFAAPDQWGETVEGYELVWVVGRDFDGRLHRFNDLELITDKRTYRPGEICHLMINTARPRSHVLFADEVDSGTLLSYRLLRLTNGHAIVDVPIREGHQPNFFVEATTVSDARLHQEAARICVPPEDAVADVTVRTDRAEYRPGEESTVTVTARKLDGSPADVQVALTAFDKSVLYIQEEYTPPIAKFFHGRLRHHRPSADTNLTQQFSALGRIRRPFQQLYPLPPGWHGTWGVTVEDWAAISQEEFDRLGSAYASRGKARSMGLGAEGMALAAPQAARGGAVADAARAAEAPAEATPEAEFAEPTVRKEFADTALWLPSVGTGPDGEATITFRMPENLTTWKLNAWAMSRRTRVGQDATEAVTTKNLLVRLQAPRFFMEYDEVVISAIVHNYLAGPKTTRVSLEVPSEHLQLMAGQPACVEVEVPAEGQQRVDWRAKVLKEGRVALTVTALTDEESDAVQMSFPVLVHGITKQDSFCGGMRPEETEAVRTVEFIVPEKRRPELTRLEVQYAPSLVGAMLDALPYCLDYPYGCTEQTVSRFLPAVLTLKTLRNMGISLEDVRSVRGRLEEVRRIAEGEHRRLYADSPIFDSDEMHRVIRKGLRRIADMQHDDGGWAWWKRGDSSGYLTSYVLHALLTARECDVAVDQSMIDGGLRFLQAWAIERMRREHWRPHATHAFVAYVLSLGGMRAADEEAGDCIDRLYAGRDHLNLYGKALLSMALANLDEEPRARTVLRNIMQYLQQNPETGIAWFRTPERGWWYWYNSDIETNAWCLRAIVRLNPDSDVAPRLVKWLLENRRNGYYWRSTRDTTLCVAAMSDFVVASGEGRPDYTLTLSLDDGSVVKSVRINKDNFFTYDNRLVIEGVPLSGGRHTLTIRKEGPGALYYSAWVRYFTKEEDIEASGLQLKLRRRYFRLEQIPYQVEVEGSEGQKLTERRLRYERVPLADGDPVRSGDVIQVELEVEADNDYTYLVFEDMKPAGCEPTAVRSGGEGQEGFWSYMELRDEKVAFFADFIGRGRHLLRYRLRAETPGVFHALPATVRGMYAPELRGNSNEFVVRVRDR